MKEIPSHDLTQGSVEWHIIKLTFGMLGGFVGMSAFNIADTYFISRLGKEYLAAMGFVTPLVMFIGCICLGIGIAVAAIVARKIGARDHEGVKRFMSDTMLFAFGFVLVLAMFGLFFAQNILQLMGAEGFVLELALRYLNIWFCFVAFMFVPMLANNAIRATGHALIPAFIMGGGAVLNILLDWLMIFGNWGFPRLELEGAVWATVIARFCSFMIAISLLYFKFHLIGFAVPRWERFKESCRELLATAIPAIGNNVLRPLGNMLIIGMIATFGNAAVAGTNAGTQIMMFSFMLPMAMGSVLMPFVGQNYAASKFDRIRIGWNFSIIACMIYAVLSFVLLLLFGRPLAMVFSKDPAVYEVILWYLYIILALSGFCHIAVHTGFIFNAVGKPLYASVLYVLRIIVFMLPLAWIGMEFYGVKGIFAGVSLANLFAGIVAWVWFSRIIKTERSRQVECACSQENVDYAGQEA